MSFVKSKLEKQVENTFGSIIKMFAQKKTLETFPFKARQSKYGL
jgi:hypothetical protein